jgi:hypothetical protein
VQVGLQELRGQWRSAAEKRQHNTHTHTHAHHAKPRVSRTKRHGEKVVRGCPKVQGESTHPVALPTRESIYSFHIVCSGTYSSYLGRDKSERASERENDESHRQHCH